MEKQIHQPPPVQYMIQKQKDETIDVAALFFRFLSLWYIFVIAILITLTGAYLYTKFTKSVYEVDTTVLIDDKNKTVTPDDFLGEIDLFSQTKNILNEKVLLKSYSLIRQTIDELNLYVSYYEDKQYGSDELYRASPFIIVFDTAKVQPIGLQFNVSFVNDSTLLIKAQDEAAVYHYGREQTISEKVNINFEQHCKFGEILKSEFFSFSIQRNPDFRYQVPPDAKESYLTNHYYFVFNNPSALTLSYKNALTVALLEEELTVFQLSLKGQNVSKIVNFLNMLTRVYIRNNLEKKNKIASNTVQFIDNQLSSISDSLHFAENRLEKFRSAHKIMNVSFQAQELFTQMRELENERAISLMQMNYYKHLKKSIKENSDIDDLIAPSTMGINDPLLNKLVMDLTDLNSRYKSLSYNTNKKSSTVKTIEFKIENAKKLLLENVENIIESTKLSLRDIGNRLNDIDKQVRKLPQTERMLFGIERQFKLNDAVYTYLLEKRAEAQIARASNIPDSEVIDPARTEVSRKISTRHRQIYIIALLIGLLLPAGIIFLIDIIRNVIVTKKDVENITDVPILGHVIHNQSENPLIFADQPKAMIAEAFRSIRTNLQFFSPRGTKKQTILITSSVQNEGKTFTAINLASALAIYEKKTLLMGFDFRKTKIHKHFKIDNDTGISSVLIERAKYEDVIQKTEIPNLDVMAAGIVPPNPAELIASSATGQLFERVKNDYDYIIIDTPPVGSVSDALILMQFSDINIFIARHKFTSKKIFSSIMKDMKKNDIKNLCILINDVALSGIMYRYGYNYGYAYQYGYED